MKIFNLFKQISVLLALMVIIFAASWALLHKNLFFVHDFIHAARIIEMYRGLTEGQFPVRWSDNFGYGYGMPLFQFYAPLPFFTGSLFLFLNTPINIIVKLLFFIPSVITAIGAYKLGKQIFEQHSTAVVVSAAYTLSAYRAVNLFVRGAVSEAWAMAFLPLILYFGLRVIAGKASNWKYLVVSVMALLLSHNITAMLFLPVSALMLFFFHLYEQRNIGSIKKLVLHKNLLRAAGSYLLAVVTTAFYWLPAVVEKNYTILSSAILNDYFDFHLHFLYIRQFFSPEFKYGGSVWGPEDDLSFFLGWGQLILLGLLIFLLGKYLWQKRNKLKDLVQEKQLFYTVIFGFGALFALFMSLLKAQSIWEALPFLSFVQFPWRLLSIATLFISVLSGAALYFIPKFSLRLLTSVGILLLILVSSTGYFQPEKYLEDDNALYYTDANRIRSHMSEILPDYIPEGLNLKLAVAQQPYANHPSIQADTTLNRAQEKVIDLEVKEPLEFVFNIADYPGWQVYLNGNKAEKITTKDGLVALSVPKGNHQVAAQLQSTPVRLTADIISVIGFIGILLLLLIENKYLTKNA